MTWPPGDADHNKTGGQYQGSYPASPFQRPPGSGYPQPVPYEQYVRQQTPPPPAPPPGGRTGLLVVLVALGAVVALGIAAGAYLLTRNGTTRAGATTATTITTTTQASTEPPATTAATTPPGQSGAKPDPVVPGWQVAVSGKRKLAYDVPPDWEVLGEDVIIGFEDASGPKAAMSGAAIFKKGYCAESETAYRAGAGFAGYRDTDLDLVAVDAAGKWGRYGYLGPNDEPPQVEVSPAEPITVNGLQGAHATATVRVTTPTPCAPPAARVHVVALPAPEGSYTFVVLSDEEVPDGLPEETFLKIINTVRAYG